MLAIVPSVALAINYLLQTQVVLAGIASELIRQAALVAEASITSVEIWQDPAQAQAFAARISPRLSAKLMLFDPQGRLVVSSDARDAQFVGKFYAMPELQSLLAKEARAEVRYYRSQISDVIVPVVSRGGQLIGFVWLTNPLTGLYARSELLRSITLWVSLAGVAGGLLLGLLLARDVERPLQNASRAAYQLAEGGDPPQELREEGPGEVRVLARAFNALLERLRSSEELRRRQLANTVHELGRPLGALLSAIQALNSGAVKKPALRAELLQGMEREALAMRRMLEDLTRLERSQPLELQRQPVAVAQWLTPLLATWSKAAQQKGLRWQTRIAPALPQAVFDPQRVAQALGNLLSNAIRYTPPGGEVAVEAAAENGFLLLRVRDSGIGIDPGDLERIFQPFYRGKDVRHTSDGMGLGLTIARDIAAAHGGDLRAQSARGQGSLFTLRLPLE